MRFLLGPDRSRSMEVLLNRPIEQLRDATPFFQRRIAVLDDQLAAVVYSISLTEGIYSLLLGRDSHELTMDVILSDSEEDSTDTERTSASLHQVTLTEGMKSAIRGKSCTLV